MPKQFEYLKKSISKMDDKELEHLGKEGWELVSTYTMNDATIYRNATGVFKREIESFSEQKQTQSNDNKYSWER